jgi:hypothetical protein
MNPPKQDKKVTMITSRRTGQIWFRFTILNLRVLRVLSRKITPAAAFRRTRRAAHIAETLILAAEQRTIVAHGATVGFHSQNKSSPGGAKEGSSKIVRADFLSPLPGLALFCRLTHGFTVGYFLSSLRDFAAFARQLHRLLLREAVQRAGQPAPSGAKSL